MEKEEIDSTRQKYLDTVNMSYSELKKWSETKCSKEASVDREPIERNLRLLEKKADDWTEDDAKEANRTISFVSRMKGAEQGEPVSEECPYSKRDISLRNWAFNPDKNKKSTVNEDILTKKYISGDSVKALPGGNVSGYLVTFDSVDLEGEKFTKDTFFGYADTLPVLYHHAQDDTLGSEVIGKGYVTKTDVGLWIQAQLNMSDEYQRAIYQMAKDGKLGWSSGTAPHTRRSEEGTINQWFLTEASLTPTPAEPKNIAKNINLKITEEDKGDTNMEEEMQDKMEMEEKPEENKMEDNKPDAIAERLNGLEKIINKLVKSMDEPSINRRLETQGVVSQETFNPGVKSLGDWCLAIKRRDMKRLTKVYNTQVATDYGTKALNETIGSEGGFLVPEQFISQLMSAVGENSIVEGRATVFPMQAREMVLPVLNQTGSYVAGKSQYFGGVSFKWTTEGETKEETEPTFKQERFVAYKLAGITVITDELLMDSAVGIESVLTNLFAKAIAYETDYNFLRGDGIEKPLGVYNSGALVQTDADSTPLTVAELSKMLSRLLPDSYGKSVWVVHPAQLTNLLATGSGANNPLTYLPNLQDGVPMSLMGMPVLVSDKLPSTLANGALLLADFSYYVIGNRQQITVDYSEHYKFAEDEKTWRVVRRVAGKPWMTDPIQISSTSTQSVSPFVRSSSSDV